MRMPAQISSKKDIQKANQPVYKSYGVSMFQVQCVSDEFSIDQTLKVRGLLDNGKCKAPLRKMELTLSRILKYRTDT